MCKTTVVNIHLPFSCNTIAITLKTESEGFAQGSLKVVEIDDKSDFLVKGSTYEQDRKVDYQINSKCNKKILNQ